MDYSVAIWAVWKRKKSVAKAGNYTTVPWRKSAERVSEYVLDVPY